MKKAWTAVVSAYGLFCIGLMFMLPMNKFEWMLDEPGARAGGLDFCGLPVDHNSGARIFSLLLLLPLWAAGITQSVRDRNIRHSLWIASGVSGVWAWRYFVHYPLC